MTAVEWLIDRLEVNKIIPNPYPGEYWNILKRGALEMEEQEKIEFACKVVEVSAEKYIQGKTTEQIAKELIKSE